MINDLEVKRFFEEQNQPGIANELSPDKFAVLFLSQWKEEHSLTAEESAEWFLPVMLKYVDLIPFGPTPYFDETKDIDMVVKSMMKKCDKEILSATLDSNTENLDNQSSFENKMRLIYQIHPDPLGIKTASAFWKFKKSGLMDFHFSIEKEETEIKPSELALKIFKNTKDLNNINNLFNDFQ